MLNLIFAIKFVHVLAAAAMFGTALAVALFMVLADRSGNVSVIAVTARFAVVVDLMVIFVFVWYLVCDRKLVERIRFDGAGQRALALLRGPEAREFVLVTTAGDVYVYKFPEV